MSSLNTNPTETCNQAQKILNQSTGWQFAKFLHLYYGDISITLRGEGTDGGDLAFAVSSSWLELNDPFLIRDRDSYDAFESKRRHAVDCENEKCQEAIRRIHLLMPYMRPENRRIPGGEAFALLLQFSPGNMSIETSRSDALPLVEEFKPFLLWLNEPDLWTPVPK